jgi:alginate O-acetyltransferase complex protein AlgI
MYYCALLVIEKAFLLKFLEKIPAFFQHVYTLFFVVIGWLLFVSESQYLGGLGAGLIYLGNMFGIGTVQGMSQGDIYDITRNFVFFVIMAIAATPLPKRLFYKFYEKSAIVRYAAYVGGVAVLIFGTAYLVDSSFNPFLYFRF